MAEKQIIISIGREYGSGGHEIASRLAEKFNLNLYDSNLLQEVANEHGMNAENLTPYDELQKSPVISRTVRGFSNSNEKNVAEMQFNFLKKKAKDGESFVVVGRCAEEVLKEFSCCDFYNCRHRQKGRAYPKDTRRRQGKSSRYD